MSKAQSVKPALNIDLLKAQLLALSIQLEALQSQVAALMSAIEPECAHDNKQNIGTIGHPPIYRCPDCGAEWSEEED